MQANFDRQKSPASNASVATETVEYAQIDLTSAEFSRDIAEARLQAANKAFGNTELRANAAGLVTRRVFEVGQLVLASQLAFSLSLDDRRDAVFELPQSVLLRELPVGEITVDLLSNQAVTAIGHIREISPPLDRRSSMVRVKVTIENPPADMKIGSAIVGTAVCKRLTPYCDALLAIGHSAGQRWSSPSTSSHRAG